MIALGRIKGREASKAQKAMFATPNWSVWNLNPWNNLGTF
jgi:hypothetical protein